jgi:biopolymer transport protein ExbD
MRRVRSKLSDSGMSVIALAGVNLVLLLCICVLLNSHRLPKYGLNVVPAESHFLLSQYDRTQTHVISITPGEHPRYYLEGVEIKGGLSGVQAQLDKWRCEQPSRVTVILVNDAAVPSGTVQAVVDSVLTRGFNCALSGRPLPN